MSRLKIASFNAEWMTKLFVDSKAEFYQGPSLKGGIGSKPKDCQKVAAKIAGVIEKVNAHLIGIVEGPPRKKQMELFVKEYLNDKYHVFSMQDGSQSNHVLVKKSCPVEFKQIDETDPIFSRFREKVSYYRWDEVKQESHENLSRDPVAMSFESEGEKYELLLLHTKSKISKLKRKSQYTQRDKTAIVDALRSRQKLSAEIAAVRRYVTHAILSKRVEGCIVMGDLNDGPHRDIFEEKFLIHNIVDELRGGFNREAALMHHSFPQKFLNGSLAYTAEFNDPTQEGKKVKVLLDHLLVTSGIYDGKTKLKLRSSSAEIEHEAYDEQIDGSGKARDDRPSDHRPISAVFDY